MSRDQIIEQLFTGQNFRDAIAKMAPFHLQDDLQMEVISRLLEQPEEKIIGLHGRKQLDFYVVRIILNEVSNKYSQFSKKFRAALIEYNEEVGAMPGRAGADRLDAIQVSVDDIQAREVKELREDRALAAINSLEWYDQEMVKLYVQLGTYRAIEKATQIPWESAYKTIQKALKLIRCQVMKLSSTAL